MQPLWLNGATLTIALLFYLWKTYRQIHEKRRRALRDRVTYMLWTMAEEVEFADAPDPVHCPG
jgi:hypothetical protein